MDVEYFSGESEILLADGSYKNICQLSTDDLVLNMRGEPVAVTKIDRSTVSNMMEIRYNNWYKPFYCTDNCKLLTSRQDEDSTFEEETWTTAKDLVKGIFITSESNIYRSLYQKDFEYALSALDKNYLLKPTYELGLLFGLYAGYGDINNDSVQFKFGTNDELVNNVSEILNRLFDVSTTIDRQEFIYTITATSSHLVNLFSSFNDKLYRKIPRIYWASNIEYVRGIYHGLIDFDIDNNISRYIPISNEMAQAFVWICSVLGLSFRNDTPSSNDDSVINVFPLFVTNDSDDSYLGEITDITYSAIEEPVIGWNITVGCPTNSVIVNNLVIHTL